MNKRTVVFLHIPKTAGQTVHSELVRVVGKRATSPVRVHTQASPTEQFPSGFRLYSGHLDWICLNSLPHDRFVFSVLRDPRERIASFYFYLLDKAEKLSPKSLLLPENTGMRNILRHSTDDYFFSGSPQWRRFIRDHFDNFYTAYFATRKMRGWSEISKLKKTERMGLALAGAKELDGVYDVKDLARLEADLLDVLGKSVNLVNNRVNPGPHKIGNERWPELMARLESDESVSRLEKMANLDTKLMSRLLVC
ncbi:sulfotransferase family 2 domain-containing protein [Shimia sp. MIT910701]|uniref:sulfotransferase family 2 domain-containing protein n=1 Tax=Shimia sp. MIT910701 TaxID=3096987 RepID=UPI00399B92E1